MAENHGFLILVVLGPAYMLLLTVAIPGLKGPMLMVYRKVLSVELDWPLPVQKQISFML